MLRLIAVLAVLLLAACEFTHEQAQSVEQAFEDPPTHTPPIVDHPDLPTNCQAETYHQPHAEITKKVDVLFVVDSSGSLREERTAIAEGVSALVNALPGDVDFNFGVMMSHVGFWAGRLYGYNDGLPLVLNSTTGTIAQNISYLRDRMRFTIPEPESDGGEAGIYSLSKALAEPNLSNLISQGMFRSDAALIVVFVADENDICATYPAGVTPAVDVSGREQIAKATYCNGISTDGLIQNLRAVKGDLPIILSGILYNEKSQFIAADENELGYGYLEVIDKLGGVKIDLAGGQFNEGLKEIGTLAVKKLHLVADFPVFQNPIDASTLAVEVDGQEVPIQYSPEINEVHLTGYAGKENSEVYVRYCAPVVAPVVINNVVVSQITKTSANICWVTDRPATSQARYTLLSSSEVFLSPLNSTLVTQHCLTLSALHSDSLYSVRVLSSVSNVQTISNEVRFRTAR